MIFLSYASPDRERVMPHYLHLKQRGFNPWIDRQKLLGGQNWDYEIRRALDEAAIIVMFISNNSTNRRGYVQREIRLALNKLEEKLIGDIYIIPVLLDKDAERPDQLADIQFLNSADEGFIDSLIAAINFQLTEAQTAVAVRSSETGVGWSKSIISEEWNGAPGYALSGEVLHLSSEQYSNLGDFADLIKGWFKSELLEFRRTPFEQMPLHFNLGQHRALRTSTWDARPFDPIVKGRLLSVVYGVSWYGAGAAHPNYHYTTYNFFLDPFAQIKTLRDIFADYENAEAAFLVMRDCIVRDLDSRRWQDGEEELRLPEESIRSGTASWDDLQHFSFEEEGLQFFFAPYQVGPYAFSTQTAMVPYRAIVGHLSPLIRAAGDIWDMRPPAGGSGIDLAEAVVDEAR